ncbi:MAG: hypothetical protein ACKV19_28335 [Verrucomicrobiales bacterium]
MPISFSDLHIVEPSPQARWPLWDVLTISRGWRYESEHSAGADE